MSSPRAFDVELADRLTDAGAECMRALRNAIQSQSLPDDIDRHVLRVFCEALPRRLHKQVDVEQLRYRRRIKPLYEAFMIGFRDAFEQWRAEAR